MKGKGGTIKMTEMDGQLTVWGDKGRCLLNNLNLLAFLHISNGS